MSSFPKLPPNGGTSVEVATVVNNALDGKLNVAGKLTLTSDTQEFRDPRCGVLSVVLLSPRNAMASGGFVSDKRKGHFTVSALVGAEFDYAVLG